MASTWPSARSKTFANGGTGTPGDFNAVQDQYIRPAGILMGDLAGGAGKSIIPATETRTNVAYGTLTTPDQVAGIVLPTDGLIVVAYQATWQESVATAARAAIFIAANQLKAAPSSASVAAPVVNEASTVPGGFTNSDLSLGTAAGGLVSESPTGATAYSGDVTTGQIVGSCHIFAAAGTYTVSVQFKASSGSVTAKNRKLWVWTLGF